LKNAGGFGDDDWEWFEAPFYSKVSLDIKMEGGKRLFIAFIHSSDLQAPFLLYLIGRSTFEVVQTSFGRRGGNTYWYGLPIHFVEKNIDIQLNSVEDVIENYDLILNFTDSLTFLVDIDDIDIRNQMIREMHQYLKYIRPIIVDGEKWYILNITQDVLPNHVRFYRIENMNERERSYIHYRN
jgi:hypothetical protein